ncbi:carbohydrate kinase family protein [Herbiconiux daphne]|uniref:Carbohydrate kinase n=1 Tax=Herbiconiux daphne TaxID=2970914 RepID=A0ABT2H5R0_9MICO|nr:carbohydrate kinase [Herbiconiux daphne]MCS5735271.1 carbohydrate kinase [Herbiconiux daphne]
MAATVLAIGESLVDVVESAEGAAEHPGGSPMNIAYGLARLGRSVKLLTAVGPDARGESIVHHLREAGVEIVAASFRDEVTSSATARLRADGSAEYDFDVRWSVPAGVELPVADIVHTGSLGAFVEPGGSAVVALLRSRPDAIVTFDPNIRPALVGSHDAACARFVEIARLSTVLKLSDEDAEWLFPRSSVDESIDRILQLGPAVVAVTRGGDGAVLATASERRVVPGVPVTVVDTIGAGDSFMSALIWQLAALLDAGVDPLALRDGSAFDAAELARIGAFAADCAAVTVSRAGANPPTLADLPR